jgi:hypothetical protein
MGGNSWKKEWERLVRSEFRREYLIRVGEGIVGMMGRKGLE